MGVFKTKGKGMSNTRTEDVFTDVRSADSCNKITRASSSSILFDVMFILPIVGFSHPTNSYSPDDQSS